MGGGDSVKVQLRDRDCRGTQSFVLEIVPQSPFEDDVLRQMVPDPQSQCARLVLHPVAGCNSIIAVREDSP